MAFCAAVAVALLASATPGVPASEQQRILELVEQLDTTAELDVDGAPIAAVRVIPRLYERTGFERLWKPRGIDELIEIIARMDAEGLDPEDYHLTALRRVRTEARAAVDDDASQVDLDVLATDALLRLGYHLMFGKVNPYDLFPNWNLSRTIRGGDPVEIVLAAIEADSLRGFIDQAVPRGPLYPGLKQVLAEYRKLQNAGGWSAVPAGPALKPGMRDPRVAAVRERLRVTGELESESNADPATFDTGLRDAVVEFQLRHALDADGVIGARTLDAMNTPVEDRIDQIRANLERGRWVFREIEDDFIVVNIARFRAYLARDGEIVWTSRAQVGKPYRQTPVFTSTLKYLVVNPTWTVPPTILRKDILPKVRQDPGYLAAKNIRVLTHDGDEVDVGTIDWPSLPADRFPYILRQDPGPTNALGRVKFIFPNEHFVFLHDTPSKALFGRTERAFSSGCIRVQDPFGLAALLLEGTAWDRQAIDDLVESAEMKTIFLPEPLTVYMLYGTVDPTDPERVVFAPDVYDRDPAIVKALDGDFVFAPPAGMPGEQR
jgi:murein L,D-transpeptidase YcbB/YkuD